MPSGGKVSPSAYFALDRRLPMGRLFFVVYDHRIVTDEAASRSTNTPRACWALRRKLRSAQAAVSPPQACL